MILGFIFLITVFGAGIYVVMRLYQADQYKLKEVADFLLEYGDVDGAHHKQWVIDQALRLAAGDSYDRMISLYEDEVDEDGEPFIHEWDKGIAP